MYLQHTIPENWLLRYLFFLLLSISNFIYKITLI